ncbi:hypothetical protein F9795_20830 [Escherichia coli]|nr:hypothetical protein [Escherichia coli]
MAQFCNFSRNIVCCYGKVRFLYCTREYPDCDAATASAGFLNGVTSLHVNDNHYHQSKRAARTVLTGMCYSVGSATRQGSSSPTRFIGQSAMTSRT